MQFGMIRYAKDPVGVDTVITYATTTTTIIIMVNKTHISHKKPKKLRAKRSDTYLDQN